MYNHIQLEKFIDKVKKEANKAAQDVFDKYNDELTLRIKKQMLSGHSFHSGMGSASFWNKNGDNVGEKVAEVLTQTLYPTLDAGFDLVDELKG